MKSKHPPEIIETERLILKKHDLSVTSKLYKKVDEDRQRLREFLPWVDLTNSEDDEKKYIEMAISKWESSEMFDFGIFLKESNELVGNIGVHTIVWDNRCAEFGYMLFGQYEGNGYVSEAIKSLEGVLFGMEFNRLEIRGEPINLKSKNVPERLKYRYEGVLRKNRYVNNEPVDTHVYSKLKEEYDVL